jgi:hypothetical protein
VDDHHHQRLPLIGRQASHGLRQFLQRQPVLMRCLAGEDGRGHVVDGGGVAPLAQIGDETVAQDAVHPCGEVAAENEALLGGKGIADGVLHQILGGDTIARQGKGLHPQLRQNGDHLVVKSRVHERLPRINAIAFVHGRAAETCVRTPIRQQKTRLPCQAICKGLVDPQGAHGRCVAGVANI